MSEEIKALEARVAELEADLQAVTKAIVSIVSTMAARDEHRMQLAERLRTIGDGPATDTEIARRLLDNIADRIETAGV
jgi:DNA-binding ferritin-like protein (Dps family)